MVRVFCVPFTSYMRFFPQSENVDLSISVGRGARETRSDVTIRQFDHGFLSAFPTHFLSNMHRFKVILDFLIVNYGKMLISISRGRPRPEVTSRVDSHHGFVFVF
jgi:hypothetical protein